MIIIKVKDIQSQNTFQLDKHYQHYNGYNNFEGTYDSTVKTPWHVQEFSRFLQEKESFLILNSKVLPSE